MNIKFLFVTLALTITSLGFSAARGSKEVPAKIEKFCKPVICKPLNYNWLDLGFMYEMPPSENGLCDAEGSMVTQLFVELFQDPDTGMYYEVLMLNSACPLSVRQSYY